MAALSAAWSRFTSWEIVCAAVMKLMAPFAQRLEIVRRRVGAILILVVDENRLPTASAHLTVRLEPNLAVVGRGCPALPSGVARAGLIGSTLLDVSPLPALLANLEVVGSTAPDASTRVAPRRGEHVRAVDALTCRECSLTHTVSDRFTNCTPAVSTRPRA